VFQITTAVVLGVYLTNTLASADHVNHLLTIGNQRLFLLSQLKNRGLTLDSLHIIYLVLIQSKITYALPAFAGQLSLMDLARFDALARKAKRCGLAKTMPTMQQTIDNIGPCEQDTDIVSFDLMYFDLKSSISGISTT